MSTVALPQMSRGDHRSYTGTATRTTPPLDLTTATAIRFIGRVKGETENHFEKTLDAGVVVVSSSAFTVALDPADTAGMTQPAVLNVELEVTELGGRVTTPWVGTLPVRLDLA